MTLSGKDFVATLQRALQGRGPGSKAAHCEDSVGV